MVGSRVDFVIGLGKKQLRSEVFRLDAELVVERNMRDSLERQLRDERAEYNALVQRNESRFDALAETHAQIIESRLGIGESAKPAASNGERQPIGRTPWKAVSATYEKRQRDLANKVVAERDAHWQKKIDEIEKRDKAAAEKK